jgi:hypothetical protein
MHLNRLILPLLLLAVPPAFAQSPGAETEIRSVIANWYAHLTGPKRTPDYRLYAPGHIDGGPGFTELNPKSAKLSPRVSHELAARALQFRYDIDRVKVEDTLARVDVWERGYFYAFAAGTTYETAADATFVLERQSDGRWLILAHSADNRGIPPGRETSPMPDMKPLWEASRTADTLLNE